MVNIQYSQSLLFGNDTHVTIIISMISPSLSLKAVTADKTFSKVGLCFSRTYMTNMSTVEYTFHRFTAEIIKIDWRLLNNN